MPFISFALSFDSIGCSTFPVHIYILTPVFFSSLELEDNDGNTDPFETVSPTSIPTDYAYFKLLSGLIEYVKEKYPKYSDYTDLLALLGQDFSVKEASDILQKPQKTLYGWIKKLRTIFDEYIQTAP